MTPKPAFLVLVTCVSTLILLVMWEFGVEPSLFSEQLDEDTALKWRFVWVGMSAVAVSLVLPFMFLARADRKRAHAETQLKEALDGLEEKVRDRTAAYAELTLQLHEEVANHERSAALLADVTENIREVFWVSTPGYDRMLYVSPAYAHIWGRAVSSLYENPKSCADSIHPDDREEAYAAISDRHREVDTKYRITQPSGGQRWIRDRSYPVRDDDGNITRIVGIAEDITELQHLQENMLHSQRLEAVGTLAGGIAHDFNNMLATIMACAETIQLQTDADDPRSRTLKQIIRTCKSGAGVVKNLLRFARKEPVSREPVWLGKLINDSCQMARATFDRRVSLEVDVEEGLWPVKGDAAQIPQLLMNLMINGHDAILKNGSGTLSISARNLRPPISDTDAPDEADRAVQITISDNGCGMSRDVADKAFDPFFTTKDPGRGTGLGLSTAHGIVDAHQGKISMDTRPGKGTTFTIRLPALGPLEPGEFPGLMPAERAAPTPRPG